MSAPSPSSGTATRSRGRGDDQPGSSASADGQARSGERLEIGLEHMRWRHFTWAAFGLAAGGFLVWKLGAVGKGIGAVLVFAGVWATWSFLRTLLLSLIHI